LRRRTDPTGGRPGAFGPGRLCWRGWLDVDLGGLPVSAAQLAGAAISGTDEWDPAGGVVLGVEREVQVRQVEEIAGRSGTTRYVLRDDEGNEYTTFRPPIGREAERFEGERAVVTFHEEERRGFRNVYLDGIAALPESGHTRPAEDHDHSDEAAWNTALDAAPWIVGTREPHEPVPADELYERLHPFKELVAEDIRRSEAADHEGHGDSDAR
jgi:hypothetical protein